MQPRPESRIKSLEQRASDIEAGIIELSSDTAEELKVIRQDIKNLDEGMMSSFKELGSYFELTEKAMATKEDLSKLRDDVKSDMAAMEGRINNNIAAMEGRLVDTIKQLWQQKPSE